MKAKGAVACGHGETAAAAEEILQEGGSAFDAVLAAMAAACVTEPVLASLAGGGFLLAKPVDGEARLYDFFVDTPRAPLAREALDFYPVHADFGVTTQEFHIGHGAIATPGLVKGFFRIQEDLAGLPVKRLLEPAIRLAREGWRLRAIDHYLFGVVGPIITNKPASRAHFTTAEGDLLPEGALFRQEELAGAMEALAEEGEALFYRGEFARRLERVCAEEGGQLTLEDLSGYQGALRLPLTRGYRGAKIVTNPPPSAGGILIAFALDLLEQQDMAALSPLEALGCLARVMALTNRARREARLHEATSPEMKDAAIGRLFDPALMAAYRAEVLGRPQSPRGTTQISVVDAAGNLASMTLSNGEGCGSFLPGTGIILNNMLGEEDLNAGGFHAWPPGSRLASMMAPTIARLPDGRTLALGSGGSNRIRSAILQVLTRLADQGLGAAEAVEAPRLHVEGGVANHEAGFPEGADALLEEQIGKTVLWSERNLFFGGVHTVTHAPDGSLEAAGDPRRGGTALVVGS